MRRRRQQTGFVCAGCKGESHTGIPYFVGPEIEVNGSAGNLYCAESHPDNPMQNESTVFAALTSAAREKGYHVVIRTKSEQHLNWEAEWLSWDAMLEAGKSYMYGSDKPMKDYIRKYSSPITPVWMKLAYQLAVLNPNNKIAVCSNRLEYQIYRVGTEYVEIALPHQDMGGEKHYITKDGKRKVQINQD